MLSLVPWGNTGASLDLMRRSPQSPNGTIELMVSELALHAETLGITRISLNFAMFRSAFEQGAQLGAGPVARLWRGLLVFFSRWWQLETLYRSNMKYQPRMGAALRVLRGRPADSAGRRRLGDRRGLPGVAVQPARQGAHRASLRRAAQAGGIRAAASRRVGARRQPVCRRRAEPPSAEESRSRLPEQVRVRLAKLKTLAAQRH